MQQSQQDFQKKVTDKVRETRWRIGANIHALRLRHGLTLEKLSRLTHLAPDTIDRLEMGKGEIRLHHLARLSGALRTDIETLVEQRRD